MSEDFAPYCLLQLSMTRVRSDHCGISKASQLDPTISIGMIDTWIMGHIVIGSADRRGTKSFTHAYHVDNGATDLQGRLTSASTEPLSRRVLRGPQEVPCTKYCVLT